MPNLSVRRLDEDVYIQLKLLATKHGVSMEEEARQIISQVVSASDGISKVFQKHFGRNNGIDLEILTHRKPHQPMDFDE